MKKIKVFALATAVLLLAWLLPWCYNFMFSKPFESDLTLYSCVTHDFLTFEFHDEKIAGRDLQGREFTQKEFDSLMPTVFYYDLNRDKRLPKVIDGIPFDVHKVERSNFVFRSSPHELNRPQVGLHQLLDASEVCKGIVTPEELFRITDHGIEFVRMSDNRLDYKKTANFTRVMKRKGFVFPARSLHASTDARKHYDNGFLLIDARGHLFQLQRFHELPACREIPLPDTMRLTHAFVTEFSDRRLLGFLRDANGVVYALENEGLALHRLPLKRPFDPERQRMVISGDMFYWNVIEESASEEYVTVLNGRDYSYVAEHYTRFPEAAWKKAARYLFPFRLQFTSPLDRYVSPHFVNWAWEALGLNLLLAGAYLWMHRRRKDRGVLKSLFVLLLGIYVFLPLLMTDRR